MTDELPLPEPIGDIEYRRPSGQFGRVHGYTADQMRAYAAAAVSRERESWASAFDMRAENPEDDEAPLVWRRAAAAIRGDD